MTEKYSFNSTTASFSAESRTPIYRAVSRTPVYSYTVNSMTIPNCEEIVFSGKNNTNSIVVYKTENGVTEVEDFLSSDSVTRMTVEFEGTDVMADSAESMDAVDWSAGNGVIIFRLAELTIPKRRYKATLTMYNDANPDGKILFHMLTDGLRFRFV